MHYDDVEMETDDKNIVLLLDRNTFSIYNALN